MSPAASYEVHTPDRLSASAMTRVAVGSTELESYDGDPVRVWDITARGGRPSRTVPAVSALKVTVLARPTPTPTAPAEFIAAPKATRYAPSGTS